MKPERRRAGRRVRKQRRTFRRAASAFDQIAQVSSVAAAAVMELGPALARSANRFSIDMLTHRHMFHDVVTLHDVPVSGDALRIARGETNERESNA